MINYRRTFLSRCLSFAEKTFQSTIPALNMTAEDEQLMETVNEYLRNYLYAMETGRLRDGIRHTLSIARVGNQLMQSSQPWVLAKGSVEEVARCGSVIALCCNLAAIISILLSPYMPATADVMFTQLNLPESARLLTDSFKPDLLKPGHVMGKPSPLFKKIEADVIQALMARFSGGKQQPANGQETAQPAKPKPKGKAKKPEKK